MATAPRDIGHFIIGESPIGVATLPFDWLATVYSQYANSPVLMALVQDIAAWFDPAMLVDYFYDNVWNVQTATGWGLDVWGRIVGVNRTVTAPVTKFLGFEEATAFSADPFNQSPLYSGVTAVQNYTLSDDTYRQLVMAKAAANIWDGSIPGLNSILRILFPGQQAYVTDGLDMSMTFTFGFALSPVQQTIIINSGILPRPAGVSVTYIQL